MMPQSPSSPRRRGPRFWRNKCCNRIDELMQVHPVGVHLLNDAEFPGAVPFLQSLLAADGILHRVMMLIPHKLLQAVLLGESFKRSALVSRDPVPQRAGHADIHRAPVKVRHDVDSRELLFMHAAQVKSRQPIVNGSGAPAFAGVTETGVVHNIPSSPRRRGPRFCWSKRRNCSGAAA